ncbi:MAG: DUF1674 domain-containing protein [Pseudomonadota bacterium]
MNKPSPTPTMTENSDTADGTLPEHETEQVEPESVAAEYGGPKGKEPTRYGDWEKNGRCIDF